MLTRPHAHDGGFDLHAAVHVAADERERLQRLCQYLLRTAEAQLQKRGRKAGVPPGRLDALAAGLRPMQDAVNALRQQIACSG